MDSFAILQAFVTFRSLYSFLILRAFHIAVQHTAVMTSFCMHGRQTTNSYSGNQNLKI